LKLGVKFRKLGVTFKISRSLTTITTPFGLYQFKFCPFGINSAPGGYEELMERQILSKQSNRICVIFIDDTVVYGDSSAEFLRNLEEVFTQMTHHNVKLKLNKCHFGCPSVEFVGIFLMILDIIYQIQIFQICRH